MILTKILLFLDRKRIKLHLMRTEYQMRNKDTSHLNPALKQNRFRVLQLLHDYWKNEEFPKNTTHKEKIPQIRDQVGTSCALAYILENSGKKELVNEIAQTNNYVYVNDVPDDHLLFDAIKEGGFTKKEAVKIQPTYGNCLVLANHSSSIEPAFAFLSMVIAIAGIAISLSVYRVSEKSNVKSIGIIAIVGILIGVAGSAELYQEPLAYSFSDYPGEVKVISIDESHSVFYWIVEGVVTNVPSEYSVMLKVEADSQGEITIAIPGIIVENENMEEIVKHSDFFVLVNGEEVAVEQVFESQHYILTVQFEKGTHEIELIPSFYCRYTLSDMELRNYP